MNHPDIINEARACVRSILNTPEYNQGKGYDEIGTIWQDNIGPIRRKIPDSTLYPPTKMVCYIGCHDRDLGGGDRFGWKERQQHIEQLRAGAQGWGIMAIARKENGEFTDQIGARRDIDHYDDKLIWKFGEVFRAMDPNGRGEDFWVTLDERLNFNDILISS